ncbi:MAG TPA: response regulator transcription factor [Ferruginibacter sp.]|nr:response regulator transcription factor [Ferruginibacter sp.]
MDIRVAIFEDRKLVRDAFEAIISGTHGLTCAGCFANAGDLDYNIAHSLPDVVLMDIEMPGMDGIEASRRIHSRFPDIKILIQTVFDDDDKVFAALCAGASGYILKNTTPAKLVESIIEVYNGGAPMSPNIASKVLSLFQKIAPQVTDISEDFQLSKREKEILAMMTEGHSFKTIAEKNFIAYETVRTHVKKIYKKLHVASLTEAVLKAIRHRII